MISYLKVRINCALSIVWGSLEFSDCHHTHLRALEQFCMLGLSSLYRPHLEETVGETCFKNVLVENDALSEMKLGHSKPVQLYNLISVKS